MLKFYDFCVCFVQLIVFFYCVYCIVDVSDFYVWNYGGNVFGIVFGVVCKKGVVSCEQFLDVYGFLVQQDFVEFYVNIYLDNYVVELGVVN